MTTAEQRQQIASTIYEQIGGGEFTAMTGAKNFVAVERGLAWRMIPRTAKGVKFIKIQLQDDDTYTLTFIRQKNVGGDLSQDMVHWDQLRTIIERVTGLDTSLTRRFA